MLAGAFVWLPEFVGDGKTEKGAAGGEKNNDDGDDERRLGFFDWSTG